MKKKLVIILAALLVGTLPLGAVFNEKDLGRTISVLRYELQQQYDKMEHSRDRMDRSNDSQHDRMVDMLKRCDELSLMLYSQNPDYTFDLTYALNEVTKQYEDFRRECIPFTNIVSNLNGEIDRYERLLEALRHLPPQLQEISEVPDSLVESNPVFEKMIYRDNDPAFILDSLGCADRDSCVFYASSLLKMYKQQKVMVRRDSTHYAEMSEKLKSSYDYAQDRYAQIRRDIFLSGQQNILSVLSDLPGELRKIVQDCSQKYSGLSLQSAWRGPVVVAFVIVMLFFLVIATVLSNLIVWLFRHKFKNYGTPQFKSRRRVVTLLAGSLIFALIVMNGTSAVSQNFINEAASQMMVYSWLLVVTFASLLVRHESDRISAALRLRTPVLALGFVVIFLRVVFVPNSLLNLAYPVLLLIFSIWQLATCRRYRKGARRKNDVDLAFGNISLIVMASSMILSWCGFVLLALQVFIWWMFQLAAAYTLLALYDLLNVYAGRIVDKKIEAYKAENEVYGTREDGAFIGITYLVDLLQKAVIPMLAIFSVYVSLYLASDMFDLTQVCRELFMKNFVSLTDADGNEFLSLSCFKITVVAELFFLFRYVSYLLKALYRKRRMARVERENGGVHVRANAVNLTLANNVIAILVWGAFIAIAVVLLKIPLGALSIVAAGLATGIGLALKDVLNNFIYGIQLMSGRLRVGDYIECDGYRGKVEKISYQSTQVETVEGAVISFTNSTLFNKNFTNLTRNNGYEFVAIPVGVAYGTSVEEVRTMLLSSLGAAFSDRKDSFGRDLVEKKHGIWMHFAGFGDSSVDLTVKQFVLVEEKAAYMAEAREVIYDTLNRGGIEIPFPQCDVHMDAGSGNQDKN